MISTSAPSTEIFTSLTSSFIHFASSAVILTLGSVALIVCSESTNHSSLAPAVPTAPIKTTDARPRDPHQVSYLHRSPFLSDLRQPEIASPTA